MLRVLLSAYACTPNYGTEPGNGWNWAVHLAERGMSVHVLAEEGARAAVEAHLSEHPQERLQFTFLRARPAVFCHWSALRYVLWQWRAAEVARALHAKEPFDIAHHVTFGSIHVPTQLWRLGIPTVFGPVGGGNTAHPVLLPYFGKARWRERLRTLTVRLLPFSPLHRRSYRRIGGLLGTNLETLRLFRAMGRPDARLFLDAGLPESFYAAEPRRFKNGSEALRLFWVGRLLPRKGLLLTLDALARVRAPWTLTVLGSGPEEDAVRAAITQHGFQKRIIWTGKRVPWDEVKEAYRTHDVLLFHSLRDSVGAQLLEAMASGLPVICLDTSGARDFVPRGAGFKVPVHSKEQVLQDLAAAIEKFAAAPAAQRSEMSRIALEHAREHTWRKRAAYAHEIYNQLLAGDHVREADKIRPDFPPGSPAWQAQVRKGFGE